MTSLSPGTSLYFSYRPETLETDENKLNEVKWFNKCVVQYYELQSATKKPQFREYLKNPIPVVFEVGIKKDGRILTKC